MKHKIIANPHLPTFVPASLRCRNPKCLQPIEVYEEGLHLIDKNYCRKCLSKQKAKKNKIKRNQVKIGIKPIRRKKATPWKTKADPKKYDYTPKYMFAKTTDKKAILTKFSPKEKWVKVTKKKFSQLQEKFQVIWNPEEKRLVSSY